MKFLKIIENGIFDENPALKLALGTCPTLAVTTSAINGIGMGLSTAIVLIGSNLMIAALRNFIPNKIRIPAFITIIAGFVTIIQLFLKAYLPSLDKALGIYIPLIVVNCIILSRAESFASKNAVVDSIADGVGMGLGFTFALLIIGGIREILGNGSIFGFNILGNVMNPALIMILPPGGFLAYGIVIGIINKYSSFKVKFHNCADCGRCLKMSNDNGEV